MSHKQFEYRDIPTTWLSNELPITWIIASIQALSVCNFPGDLYKLLNKNKKNKKNNVLLIYIAQYLQQLKRRDCGEINVNENQRFAQLIINYINEEYFSKNDLLLCKWNIKEEHEAYKFIEYFLKLFNNSKYCNSKKLSKFIKNQFEYTFIHCEKCSLCGYEDERTETIDTNYILIENVSKTDTRIKLQDIINNNNKIHSSMHNCNSCDNEYILHNVYRKFITLPLFLIIYINKDENALISI